MAVGLDLPSLAVIVGTAVVDSINPCAIGVMILLISTLLTLKKNKKQMIKIGLLYILAVFLTYFAFGLGLTAFIAEVPLVISEYIAIAVGILVVTGGIIEIKDFFWYGKGFSLMISPKRAKQIHKYINRLSIPGVIFLGAFVAAVELPCTGGPYLAITLILAQNFDFAAFLLLIIYNLIFVLPLVVILLLSIFGIQIARINEWKNKNRGYMRYLMGLIMVALGWLLILIANGTINLN